jgi:hypothetical protein
MSTKRTWIVALGLIATSACASPRHPPTSHPHLEWREADAIVESGPNGERRRMLRTSPGQVLRVEGPTPMSVAERFEGSDGMIEAWRTVVPDRDGTVLLRASLGARAWLLPESVERTWTLEERPLGRDGFDIEADALAWADGPWLEPARVEPDERLLLFHRVDALVSSEAPPSPAARAVRRVIARRVTDALRSPWAPPFYRIETAAMSDGGQLEVEGPAVLRCEVAAAGGALEARLMERARVRSVLAARSSSDGRSFHLPPLPVPPGAHRYSVEVTSGRASAPAKCVVARAVRRLGQNDEHGDLDLAMRSCTSPRDPLCVLALGLAGREDDLELRSSAGAALVGFARELGRAETYDGARSGSLARLDVAAHAGIDPAIATGWAHTSMETSRWQPVGDPGAPAWTFVQSGHACSTGGDSPRVGTDPRSVDAFAWRSAFAIRLEVEAPCGAAEAITLEVDGTSLRAQPSSTTNVWTVVVPTPRVSIRRRDGGPGIVRVLEPSGTDGECGLRGGPGAGARLASTSPQLAFGDGAAPGIELWSRVDASSSARTVRIDSRSGDSIELVARPNGAGAFAVDAEGRRWVRSGRVPLPGWAARGITIHGGEAVAVRGLERVVRDAGRAAPGGAELAEPLDERKLLDLSRSIRTASPERKGALYQERALLLARAGEAKAAREDAAAARAFGVSGDSELAVERSIRRRVEPKRRPFGLEPAFDTDARRCTINPASPRARVAALDAEAHAGPPRFEPLLAARAALAGDPADPRLASIEAHVFAGSRWRELRGAPGERVTRGSSPRSEGLVGGDGLLRVRTIAGPLSDSVSVTAQRPASFTLAGAAAKARLEVLCVPRAPSRAHDESCPLEVVVDGKVRSATISSEGGGAIDIDPRTRTVQLRMKPTSAEWGATARVVFDRKVPGARLEDGRGWVLETPETDRRYLLREGKALDVRVDAPGLLRVAAWPEPGDRAELVAVVDDREHELRVDGGWATVPVVRAGTVRLFARGGALTADLAERVNEGASPVAAPAGHVVAAEPAGAALVFAPTEGWHDRARQEPLPPTGPTSWATLQVTGSVNGSNWREGASADAPDAFAQQSIVVHRKLGVDLPWASLGALVRERGGEPSLGGRIALFERIAEVRVAAAADVHAQSIDGRDVTTIRPRGFLEYGWHALPSLTIFPRAGFDGFYTDLPARPTSARQIDDDVYSPTRFARGSLAYAQALAWWSPFFDLAVFGRARASVDLTSGELASTSSRAGGLVSLGPVDIGLHVDATAFAATPGARTRPGVDLGSGGHVTSLFWLSPGSVALSPGLGGSVRAADGRWQAFASLALVLGNGRGRRDLAPNDLGFFDGFVGGAPYRGSASGQ